MFKIPGLSLTLRCFSEIIFLTCSVTDAIAFCPVNRCVEELLYLYGKVLVWNCELER